MPITTTTPNPPGKTWTPKELRNALNNHEFLVLSRFKNNINKANYPHLGMLANDIHYWVDALWPVDIQEYLTSLIHRGFIVATPNASGRSTDYQPASNIQSLSF